MAAASALTPIMILVVLFKWAGLFAVSVLLVAAYRHRGLLRHPIEAVKKNRRKAAIIAGVAFILVVGSPFAIISFSPTFSLQSTASNDKADISSWLVTGIGSEGMLAGRFVPWRRVGFVVAGSGHDRFKPELAAELKRQLEETGQFDCVDELAGQVSFDNPSKSYDVLFVLQVVDFEAGGFSFWKSAKAAVRIVMLELDDGSMRRRTSHLRMGYQATIKHESSTRGLCSRGTHLQLVAKSLAEQVVNKLNERITEVKG